MIKIADVIIDVTHDDIRLSVIHVLWAYSNSYMRLRYHSTHERNEIFYGYSCIRPVAIYSLNPMEYSPLEMATCANDHSEISFLSLFWYLPENREMNVANRTQMQHHVQLGDA